jgi:FKBP-type peptidyl-prolyl cis-trans isomerase 2
MVEPGKIAICHYTGRMVDDGAVGEPFDTTKVDVAQESGIYHDSRDYKPLQVRVGEGEVVPGIDAVLRELDVVGDNLPVERTLRLGPEEAFGEHDAERVVEFPLEEIDDSPVDGALEPETPVHTDDGQRGWVIDVTEETATVDFNHELAGVPVEIELELLDVCEEKTKADRSDDG